MREATHNRSAPIRPAMGSLAVLLLMLSGLHVHAQTDEEAQIVTTCHYANAEWGTDMIDLCIRENRTLRSEVLSLPESYAADVRRCRDSAELGWAWVKACVLKRAPKPVPEQPAGDTNALVETCENDHGAEGIAAVMACVERGRKAGTAQ